MLFEELAFWDIRRIYRILKKEYRKNITKNYWINFIDFWAWLILLNKIRNISAHHCRLWNQMYWVKLKTDDKIFSNKFQKELNDEWVEVVVSNYYNTTLLINHLLKQINPNLWWLNDLETLFNEFPNILKEKMWFVENWIENFK
jgi:abortive infection bacteriophage resistance protein